MNDLISGELIENTYLFCLKRVSDTEEARDLSQDILCAALAAIAEGKSFQDFYAWYWRMARNKYADYARLRKNASVPLECAGGAVSESPEPLDRLIAEEEISLLNFSLSRLAATQRELIVRFYLKEQTAEQISRQLGIPLGTVKRRLFDARKNVKERLVNMSNCGKSAYAPADVNWFFGFNAHDASVIMQNKIAQQAMVICRGEPVTLNAIADEIGVAPVYLEQVLEQMEKTALIKKPSKDKYRANCCVFPMQAYWDAEYEAYKVFREKNYPEKISEALMSLKDKITSLDFYGNNFEYSYLMWIFYVFAGDKFGIVGNAKYLTKYAGKFPDETERSYRMTVQYTLPEETAEWHDMKYMSWSNLHQKFDTPNILEYVNDFEAPPFPADGDGYEFGRDRWVNGNNITLLEALMENPEKPLGECEEEQAAKFIERGLLKKDGNKLKVTLPLFDRDVYDEINTLIENAVRKDAEEFSDQVGEKVEKILLPHVRRDLMSNFIHWDMRMFFQPISYLFHYGVYESDYIQKPADYSRSAAGLYLIRYYRNKKCGR